MLAFCVPNASHDNLSVDLYPQAEGLFFESNRSMHLSNGLDFIIQNESVMMDS